MLRKYGKIGKMFLGPILLFVIILTLFMAFYVKKEREETIKNVDHELKQAAEAMPYVVGKEFMELKHEKNSINEKESIVVSEKLSEYAKKIGIIYADAVLLKDGELYLISSGSGNNNDTEYVKKVYFNNLKNSNKDTIGKIIENARTLNSFSVTEKDINGEYRKFYYMEDGKDGNVNIFITGYDLKEVNKKEKEVLLKVFLIMVLICIVLIPFGIVIRKLIIYSSIELNKRATVDELTGLYNKNEIKRLLEGYMEMGRRDNYVLTVCYIDIVKLKTINLKNGYKTGDEILRRLSEVIKNRVRKYDLAARVEGDEFLILFRSCNSETAKIILERVREEFAEKSDSDETIDFNYGVAEYTGWKITKVEELIMEAYEDMEKQRKKLS